jgi:putative transcription factor
MASFAGQQEQQWDHVVFQKKGVRGPNTSKTAHLNAQKRAGNAIMQRKMGKSNNSALAMSGRVGGEQNMCKLEEGGEETFHHAKVDKGLQTAIAQARAAKGMTQKQLATVLNVRVSMIADYEAGRAIPNPQFIVRIERKLGCKLPRSKKKRIVAAASVKAPKKKKKGPVVVNLLKGLRISK